MSAELKEKLEQCVSEMLAERAAGQLVKLTYPALAARAGVSLSTVNQPAYQSVRMLLKKEKPVHHRAPSNDQTDGWRRRYYELLHEKTNGEKKAEEELREVRASLDSLLQRIQTLSLQQTTGQTGDSA